MSGRTRGRPRIEHVETSQPEIAAGEEHLPQFATIQQVTALQDQMSTILEMLQRIAPPPHTSEVPPLVNEVPPPTEIPPAAEIPPAVEIPPSETVQTHEITSTSRPSIPDYQFYTTKPVSDKVISCESLSIHRCPNRIHYIFFDIINIFLNARKTVIKHL
ncbi:Uncharacterized protein Fot_27106 [Forsythia ovata]|uniref:Uncharacterized protein n=1 Tax=Forsythia ovata TaxID=205694 RepID=A0ABD1UDS6_9LAMI